MNNIRINRIYLKNFKHVKEATINFDNKDLVVLDGPNGFGKTTIFDATELVITGKISRIINTIDGRLGYEHTLFSNSSEVDTEIRIEFENNGEKVVIGKRIDSTKRLSQTEKKPDNWKIFQTYCLPDFMCEFVEGEMIAPKDVEEKLDIPDSERFFNLFYYVQQEENTLFLKKSGTERMKAISSLFDTEKEEKELAVIKQAKKRIRDKKRAISGQVKEMETLFDNSKDELSKIDHEKQGDISYFKLLNVTPELEWDKENVVVNINSREKYLEELRAIYKLRKSMDDFLSTQLNNQINNYVGNNDLFLNTINYANFLTKYDAYTTLKTKERSLLRLQHLFSKAEIKKTIEVSTFTDINQILNLSLSISEIKKEIDDLNAIKTKMNDFSQTIQQFKNTREELLKSFNEFKEPDESDCPVCGHTFESFSDLITSIKEKEHKFERMTDDEGKLYEQKLDDFYTKYVMAINQAIKNYLSESKNIIPDKFYDSLIVAVKMKDQILEFIKWCTAHTIQIDKFLNTNRTEVTNSESNFQGLTECILSKIKTVNPAYKDHEEKEFVFKNIFNSSETDLKNIELANITKKAEYLNSLFYRNESSKSKRLQTALKKSQKQEEKLIEAEKRIEDIIQVYETNITSHWKKIIRDIEIPFFIYSGKIIQNYQLGCGLFICEKDSFEKSIMFVSGKDNDHDAINYLSSGQLSSLVIAFTLALNKVYEKKSLGILLIDDPVQTMDEINIASFVELLRNDFCQKQIILSTHEEEISKYMRYKFSKYNLSTKRINVRNEFY